MTLPETRSDIWKTAAPGVNGFVPQSFKDDYTLSLRKGVKR